MTDFAPLLAALADEQDRTTLDARHIYRRDGKYRPGVTTVIKTMDAPRLDEWKVRVQVEGTARAAFNAPPLDFEPVEDYTARLARVAKEQYEHERISTEAADTGKQVHGLIEHHIKSSLSLPSVPPVDVSDEALVRFSRWKVWAKDAAFRPLASEARVYHAEHDYCGTLDALALVEGEVACIDFKPSPNIYPERRLQLAAYTKALVSIGWPEMVGYVNCVPRDGGDASLIMADRPGAQLDTTFDSFLALLRVFRWLKSVEKAERATKRAA
jgi:hypothetical protein